MFRVDFTDVFDMFEVNIETYIEDKLVNKQTMQAPAQIIIIQFIQLINQIKDDNRPLKVRMTRPEVIWDNFKNEQKILTNEVAFSNNAMIAWEENKK